ncbi:uncharacterized protein PHALS_14891 [Plasmopara halstedii]|uniref:Uncharacterized protein n=1 Tax=Plasmopara halstedii TaxID=4781 RepID=A0A0P1AYG5_PLAHL|nr:uncharacterized protein PHALS_14891 [Plasmopara halstedii]CEG46317.1 hypothetical protein PHALS_14891 [Plasmopara halstedii]|eukprot:XP_024582686.1 hypothetical protein PHALS_14891 [Plasmopara halstedii]
MAIYSFNVELPWREYCIIDIRREPLRRKFISKQNAWSIEQLGAGLKSVSRTFAWICWITFVLASSM